MSDDVGDRPAAQLRAAVERWSTRRVWRRRREAFANSALGIAACAAVVAAARSVLWPSAEPDVALGLGRAAALGAAAGLFAVVAAASVIFLRVRRRANRAARAIDRHLEASADARATFGSSSEAGADVVTSGWALIGEDGAGATLAVRRAARAAAEAGPPPAVPRRWSKGRIAAGGALLLFGLVGGSLDEHVVRVLVSPPSPQELDAAQALVDAAHDARPDEAPDRVAAQAERVARAVRRGDREAATRALARMENQRRAGAGRRAEASRDLRSLARALGASAPRRRLDVPAGRANETSHPRTGSASEEAERLARLLRRPGDAASEGPENTAARRRMLERLQRAREAAAQRARDMATRRSPSGAAGQESRSEARRAEALGEQLEQALSHLQQGDREAAGLAMERAARTLRREEDQLARAVTQAERGAPMHQRAAALARALQQAQVGRPGQGSAALAQRSDSSDQQHTPGAPSEEGPRALSTALASRLAALGLSQQPGGRGGGRTSRPRSGAARRGPSVDRSSHARSRVAGSGGEAVAAIRGIGARGEATTAYRDVFPDYGVQVEEALSSERVPVSRRAVVRRYFESIRPESPPEEESP